MSLLLVLVASAAFAQYHAPRVLAEVHIPKLNESSGVAASRTNPGVFWSHNDSGGGPWIYAFDRTGKDLGRWRVRNARANDWEDLAVGPGPRTGAYYLYIGDIGDNQSTRKFVTVYRVTEPDLRGRGGETAPAEAFRLEYPDGARDAEALMVHPRRGDVYIVTKARGNDRDTLVYKAAAPLNAAKIVRMTRVAKVDLPNTSVFTLLIGRITGGDISPDGTRVVLCDYLKAWEAVLPKGAAFDAIWTAKWNDIGLGQRQQGEAVCYRHDGRAIIATSEGERFPLIEVVLRAAPSNKK